jgi:ketosteroid isomerase-like protein
MTRDALAEIERIRQLKARYFRLLDAKQWDAWKDVFCADVVIDTTDDGAPRVDGRDAFVAFLKPVLEGVITAHHGHMPEIALTGPDAASGIWAMEDELWWPPDRGGMHVHGRGWYHERYRREADGEWRIAHLELRRIRVEVNGKQTFPRS